MKKIGIKNTDELYDIVVTTEKLKGWVSKDSSALKSEQQKMQRQAKLD